MTGKPFNFSRDIHNVDYQREFHQNIISHASLINDSGRKCEYLNGLWHFTVDRYDRCLRDRWFEDRSQDDQGRYLPLDYSFDHWEKVTIPSCWNLKEAQYFYYEGSAVYTRQFQYTNRGEKRVYLKFDGVSGETKIFLNRKYIGFHKGGSTPFNVEITDCLENNNRLLVVADNTRHLNGVPSDHLDWFNYGGIHRDVKFLRLPGAFIRDYFICLVPDSDFGLLSSEVFLGGLDTKGEAVLRIKELGIEKKIPIENSFGKLEFKANPELWCPENPKLYRVELTYLDDKVEDRIGFREIKTRGTDILLNGKKIFLKGVSFHEESVESGKAVTEEEMRESFRTAKDLGCNFMRLAHYPHSQKMSEIADEQGMLLWEEIPVYWTISFNNRETYDDAKNQLIELITRDRNRASVIVWSMGNENADTDARLDFMKSLIETAHINDISRPVTAACLLDKINHRIFDRLVEYLDIIGINEYYGWYDPDIELLKTVFRNSRPKKPVIITEMGAGAKAGHRGRIDELFTEDCQAYIYKKQLETIGGIPYIKGLTPWTLYDFRCPRRTNKYQNYYNRKGLLSEDRKRKKMAYYALQKFYNENPF